METVASFGKDFLIIVLKWSVFIVAGIIMFPAWFLILFVHEHWMKLIE